MKTLFILSAAFFSLVASAQNNPLQTTQQNMVSLTDFETSQKGNAVELSWTASNEVDLNNYEIQKSTNGSSFMNIGTVVAQNNGASFKYTFLDATPIEGENYYRLRSIDKKGNSILSDILHVNNGFGKTDVRVLPNPVQRGVLNLQMTNISNGKYIISLYSNAGQKVFARSLDLTQGSTTETINLPLNIGRGMYFLQVTDGVMRINKEVILQ